MRSPRARLDVLILASITSVAFPVLAHAGNPAAQSAPGTVPDLGVTMLRVSGSLALVLALLFALVALMKRARTHVRRGRTGPALETVDRMDIGARREIRLVRAGERLLVVGITEERMELLSEIETEGAESVAAAAPADFRTSAPLRALAISS